MAKERSALREPLPTTASIFQVSALIFRDLVMGFLKLQEACMKPHIRTRFMKSLARGDMDKSEHPAGNFKRMMVR
jgi:hypothetical protein